ncbi:MAG TPA: hypothetical protein VFH49_16170, partial [Aquabacterium sp.]|nr:hypothetical protein [Aquabacterium sp.]
MHLRPLARLTAPSPALARLTQFAVAAACLLIAQTSLLGQAHAQASPPPAAPAPASAPASSPSAKVIDNSAMDAELFYQILLSELRLRQNDPGYAYQVYLEVARQHRSSQLFQRSVEIALSARAGEQALAAARSWHTALPQDRQASEYTAQILMALGRSNELAEPLRSLIALAPQAQQAQIIASLPRSLSRLSDRKAAATVVDEVTEPWRTPLPGLAEAWAASSEAWLGAGDHAKALERLRRAHTANPHLLNVGLLAVDLMAHDPTTETIVKQQLARQDTAVLRLAYARKLVTLQRLADAAIQLDAILVQQPDNALAWLTLGAVRTELKQLDAAEQ